MNTQNKFQPLQELLDEGYDPYNSAHHLQVQRMLETIQKVIDSFNDVKSVDDIEKIAMDSLKNKWSHLYQFGYPQMPYPTNYANDLNNVMLGIYIKQNNTIKEPNIYIPKNDTIIEFGYFTTEQINGLLEEYKNEPNKLQFLNDMLEN